MRAGELSVENYRTFNRLVREEMEAVSIELAKGLADSKYYDYLVELRNKLKFKIKAK